MYLFPAHVRPRSDRLDRKRGNLNARPGKRPRRDGAPSRPEKEKPTPAVSEQDHRPADVPTCRHCKGTIFELVHATKHVQEVPQLAEGELSSAPDAHSGDALRE